MQYFEISTIHLGKLKIVVGGPSVNITEHRAIGESEESQIAVAKTFHDEPVISLQTRDYTLPPKEAALKQAVETLIYSASEMPKDCAGTGLSIWGITLITFVEND